MGNASAHRPAPFPPFTGKEEEAIGTVRWFSPNLNYGFIKTDDGRSIFVHYRAIPYQGGHRLRNLAVGDRVSFLIVKTDRGQNGEARRVRVLPAEIGKECADVRH